MAVAVVPQPRVLAAPGDPAPLFGSGGFVLQPLLADSDLGRAIAIQADGKILVVGTAFNTAGGTQYDNAVARFLPDGTLDPAFGTGGVIVSGGPGDEVLSGIKLDSEGRIVVAGSIDSNSLGVIGRLTPAGVLDTTFAGGDGFVIFDQNPSGQEGVFDVAILDGGAGAIVAVGYYNDGVSDVGTTVCVKGGSGIDAGAACDVFTPATFALESGMPARFNSIKAYGSDAFVVSGLAARTGGQSFFIARYAADGTPDASYGIGGVVEIAAGSGPAELGEVIVQPDNKIVAAGSVGGQIGVFRSTADGLPDITFGTDGLVLGPASTDHATALGMQPSGALVVGGYDDAGRLRLLRFTPVGLLDTAWGDNGVVTTTLPDGGGQLLGIALDTQADIIAAGAASNGTDDDFLLAKYEGYDLTLHPLTFASVTGVPLSTLVVSDPVAVPTLLNPALASTVGGEFAVSSAYNCSGDVQAFGSTPFQVSTGQWVCVRHLSSATNLAATTTTFSLGRDVGGTVVPFQSANFVSTTAPLIISSEASASFTVLTPDMFVITTVGGPAATISIAEPLPAGLALTNNGDGTATLAGTAASGTVGSYDLTVTAANGTGMNATQVLTLGVQKASQNITFMTPSSAPIGTLALAATASSGLPVTIESLTLTACTVSASTANLLTEGTCELLAHQPGNADYLPAADVQQSLTVLTNLPGTPIGLTVEVSDAQVTLDWSPAPGPAATHYLVEIGHQPGLTSIISRIVTTTTDSGFLPSGVYYFRVRAINGAGLSAPSAEVSASVATALPIPGPPTAFAAGVSGGTVGIRWQPAPFGAAPSGYRIEVGSDYGLSDIAVFPFGAGQTSLVVDGVPAGTYVIRARAVAGANVGLTTPELRLTVGPLPTCTAPPVPPIIMTPLVTNGIATVTWLGVDSPDGYIFSAGTAPGLSDLVVTSTGTVAGIAGAPETGTYALRVAAATDCGTATSTEAFVTIGPPVPVSPIGLSSSVVGNTVTLTWSPSTFGPAAIGYVVEAGATAGQTFVRLPAGVPTLTLMNVPSGTYVVRVRGANAAGIGPPSSEITVVVH